MKFSHRHGFDPNRQQGPIVEDAPKWLRDEFFINILSKLSYVDLDSRVKNTEKLPLGIKELNERLCVETQREMDDADWDSWTCSEGLAFTIKHCEWYQFYDCVEVVGDELKTIEPFYIGAPGYIDYSKFTFDAYRSKVVSVRASHLAQLSRLPAMRQQLLDLTCPPRRQTSENVLQVGIRIMRVELGRLDQAHQRSSAFATA